MRFNKHLIIAATCAVCAVGLAAGCAPQQAESGPGTSGGDAGQGQEPSQEESLTPEQQAVIDGAEGTTNADINEDFYPGKEYLDNLWDRWDQVARNTRPRSGRCLTATWCSARPPSTR